MAPLRTLLLRHRAFALLLVAAALCIKAVVPAGLMVGSERKVLTVEICADTLGTHLVRQIAVPIGGRADGKIGAHQSDTTCPFGALAMASLGGADAALLAAALAFVMALGLAPRVAPLVSTPARLRPPLRGPPAYA
jgi:hypothetical protein